MKKDPAHHLFSALQAINDKQMPCVDAKAQALIPVLQGVSTDTVLTYAWDKYQDEFSRTVLNSLFLASATYEQMREVTGVPIDVLQRYHDYFFDTTVFRDQLERLSYVQAVESTVSAREAQFLRAALAVGPSYVIWLLNGKPKDAPREVQNYVMMEGMYRSASTRGTTINSDAAKNAQRWLVMAQKAASDLMRNAPDESANTLQELKLALEYQDQTQSEGCQGMPAAADILH